MFDIGWSELLLIGAIALVVIGPKDLPKVLRTVGQATANLRRMAGEFQAQFNEAMREAELDEIKKNVESLNEAASFNPIETVRNEIRSAVESKPSDSPAAPAAAGEATAAAAASVEIAAPDLPAPPDVNATVAAAAAEAQPKPKPRRKAAPKIEADAEAASVDAPAAETAPQPARRRTKKAADTEEQTPGEGASA
ncbi:Sec-independent protein translocase protein TatB [Chelatococcus sp. SYSU_G07232]|uniref:Sec-independent protein translocase protein TatB n=1 Tax=Chelatococcus albus TaxID=3047466 RepID=A0ABT7ADQ3_9HYPH|nr:Sec-independent protein translocase protein TatB [Chelatococcus sp. SYSU_G07232]MDJ1157132.1 Sec-independent protein translocase protein TatB [Chelatococcus sp. SYSU_G07232]